MKRMTVRLTQNQIQQWGGPTVYREAEALVKRGGVLRAEMNGAWIEGVVARSSGADLHTKLRVHDNGTAESHCPCFINRDQGLICPHVVALAILVMQRHTDPLREQKYREEQRHARAIAAKTETAGFRRNPRGTPAALKLFLPGDWTDAFARDAIEIGCVFQVGAQLLPAAALTDPGGYALSRADDALLAVIEDICEGTPPAHITVNKPDFLNIIELWRGALPVTDNTDVEVRSTPLDFSLRVDLDRENGELLIFPETAVPGAGPTTFPDYLAHGKKSWALANNTLWPLKQTLPLPYHGIYAQPVAIPRADVLRFLKLELPLLRQAVPVVCEIDPDLFTTACAQPIFHLAIRGSPASLAVALRAVYGETAFAAAGPDTAGLFTLPDPDNLLHYLIRNPEAELRAVRRLNALGFAGDQGDRLEPLVGARAVLNFLGSDLPALRRMGWKVTTEGRVADYHESLPVVTPVVCIEKPASTTGWFEVTMGSECGGASSLTPADIQRALNRNESFVERDGKTVLLDREAVASMRDVFADCQARDSARPGAFRLPAVYAPFVQASLAAIDGIDVEEPPDWRTRAAQQNRDLKLEPVPLGSEALEQTLRDYQKQGVYWLRFLERSGFSGVLADEMGLGKTVQTLAWINLERCAADARGQPALIVCPTSLVENWSREAERFVPRLRRLVLNGPARHSLFDRIPGSDLVITSYALLRRDLESGYAGQRFSIAVLDEAQHIKNRSTQNAAAARQIQAANRLVLTGTPVENSVADLWSLLDFLMPGYLGEYETFHASYEAPIAGGGEPGAQAQIKLRRKLHPFLLRRVKKEVARDLPDKIQKVSFCALTPDQQQVYNTLLAESRRRIGDLVREKGFARCHMEILAVLLRLRQVCCHLGLLPAEGVARKAEAPSAKLNQFFEILDEALDGGHRILVFSQFVSMLRILRAELDARGIAHCYLDGQTRDRLEQVHRFNHSPEIPLFLISLKAGGTGLNLTGADMVVHFDPWWNPAVEDQATDRAHRIGQKKTVYSIKLIAEHTVEENVLALQKRKQAVITATVGATDEAVLGALTWDDVQALLEA